MIDKNRDRLIAQMFKDKENHVVVLYIDLLQKTLHDFVYIYDLTLLSLFDVKMVFPD